MSHFPHARSARSIAFAFAAVLMLGAGAEAYAAQFSYRAAHYPVTEEACPAAAEALGERFAEVTGASVTHASCEVTFSRTYDIVIHYGAEAQLPLVSTWYEWAQSQGRFAKRDECLAAIPSERQVFEAETGLRTVAAYCYPETSLLDQAPHPFVLRLDAFGRPPRRPFVLDRGIYGVPMRPVAAIAADVAASTAAAGLLHPKVLVDYTQSLHRLLLQYYAPRELPLDLEHEVSFATPAACAAGAAEVTRLYESVGVRVLSAFCVRREFSEPSELYTLNYVQAPHQLATFEGTYLNVSQCLADRERVLAIYRDERELDAVGAVCDQEEGSILTPDGVYLRVFIRL
jgi:hypothetical protein